MIACIYSCCVIGLDTHEVMVEADIGAGLPAFNIVGLPDIAIKESRERIKAAMRNSGFSFPAKKLTINLGVRWSVFPSPADVRNTLNNFNPQIYSGSKAPVIDPASGQFVANQTMNGQPLIPATYANGIIFPKGSLSRTKLNSPSMTTCAIGFFSNISAYSFRSTLSLPCSLFLVFTRQFPALPGNDPQA